jgi:hypothetical protein
MSNARYGKMFTDEYYIYNVVVKDCQDKIDSMKATMEMEGEEDCYSSDGMKDIILDYLDEIEIYPDDIDKVMYELEF